MLVWNDPVSMRAYSYGESVLVNDLDLSLEANSNRYLPWVCSAKSPIDNAVRAEDHLNNMEQVTLDSEMLQGVKEVKVEVKGLAVH